MVSPLSSIGLFAVCRMTSSGSSAFLDASSALAACRLWRGFHEHRHVVPPPQAVDCPRGCMNGRTDGTQASGSAEAPAFGTVVEEGTLTTIQDFNDRPPEWRRPFSEVLGTFFLVLVAAGGGMMGRAFPDTISRSDAVAAPVLMVLAIIVFHRSPAPISSPVVSIAFARRVISPGDGCPNP